MKSLGNLRRDYHAQIGAEIVRISGSVDQRYPNFADGSSRSSIYLANGIAETIGFPKHRAPRITGQEAGARFEKITCDFIRNAFTALEHLRPGRWRHLTSQTRISNFAQYQHLSELDQIISKDKDLSAALGHDYIVTPDIVITRSPATRDEVNSPGAFLDNTGLASLTPFLEENQSTPLAHLHASISCKWTIRSDRSQNTRTEALNLIRHRKGKIPHIVAVTAEPMPMRIASLALGTGELDCVYHFALHELRQSCVSLPGGEDQLEMLDLLLQGNRLRDISDLPFDLAV